MKQVDTIEFPDDQQAAFATARRIEWLTLVYIGSAAVFLYLVMGNSQAMRTSWLEDLVSLVPPIAFLVSARVALRRATRRFPYGMHASVSIGYLTASLALLAMGVFLLTEASLKLVDGERTTIGGFEIFGTTIWAGWPMLAALAYTGIPSFFLGRAKLKLAPVIQDKVLYADAKMNRADWMAELAAAIGVLGTGFGYWWSDAVAAAVVSVDIIRNGLWNVYAAVTDLIDEMPKTITGTELDPLPAALENHLKRVDWVEEAQVRMRDEGHVFYGEIFVVPKSGGDLIAKIAELEKRAREFNWRVHDVTVMPVQREELDSEGKARRKRGAG